MDAKNYAFSIELAVRDYECDIQGVVNNANYQHYLEHARHEFLITRGISFARLHEEGVDLIVTRVEIDYKFPLRSHDRFVIRLNIEREGHIRLIFLQDIYRIPDNKLIVRARVTGVATRNGRPVPPGDLISRLGL
ncbi:MAG TPA: thioesterase family protein [Bacteroidales bacterium]|nr:thioesterase family protein [Bacteroidales bacterium]HPI68571.1 thioesterase family protein [Bacteroidales bacterium]HPR72518.1 thioesterase family protein [Bacteroidales bacterium]HRW85803.1 thioesterase family protein [Bacteroidales bacterium]